MPGFPAQPLRIVLIGARTGILAALAIALVALAWFMVWRPLVMMRQVGLAGLLPESGRQCDDPPGMPWRHCSRFPSQASQGDGVEERISLSRLTRRVVLVERAWQDRDSLTWSRQLDFIERALTHARGERIPCPFSSDSSNGLQYFAAWRFREQDVRVIGDRDRAAQDRPQRFRVQVMGFPVGYSGCQSGARGMHWLGAAELRERVERWLSGRVE